MTQTPQPNDLNATNPSDLVMDEDWRKFLTEGEPMFPRMRQLLRLTPSNPRCKICNAPFTGLGGMLMRAFGKGRSIKNPHFCAACEHYCSTHPGGAEVEITLLFADVRGSTTLAERISAVEFSRLMNRFYSAATDVLITYDALVDKFVGDEVIGLFIPGYTGPAHARKAVQAARDLLQVTGHGSPNGPWLPVGVGVHTGIVYVGSVRGVQGIGADFTALGDNVNVTARLASKAGAGEILVSDGAYQAADLDLGALEQRQLELKGKTDLVGVRVLKAS